jgi:hypothetical protein
MQSPFRIVTQLSTRRRQPDIRETQVGEQGNVRKRRDWAVLTSDRIDQAAWSECAAASAATFQGSSSSMRLIG